MAVRPSLAHRPSQQEPPAASAAPLAEHASVSETPKARRRTAEDGYRPPSRKGKRAAVAWLEPEAVKQLGIYAIQHERNVQDILVEAINDWFAHKGLPRFDAGS